MRLFLAIELNNEIKDYLFTIKNKFSKDLAKVNWVAKKNIHLTLKFLNEVDEKLVAELIELLKEIKFDEDKKPGISNLITIYLNLHPEMTTLKEIEKEYEGKSYTDFKNDLTEVIIDFLKPFQEKRQEFSQNLDQVEQILTKSEEKAKVLANSTLQEVKTKMGL